jgi:hypothetical protein
MTDHARIVTRSTDAASGWSSYARFYAWRFS